MLGGLLLCLEGDGQVEIEFTTGLRCHEFLDPGNHPIESHRSGIDALSGTDHDCGSCLDILLPRPGDRDCGALQSKPDVYPQLVGFFPSGGIQTLLFPKFLPRSSHILSSQTFTVGFSELSTVVLLI
ncbi:MAG: hypothetical protein BMS9Abin05_0539 [Rhodothermia bacterium]|nr:MAG: hypothetical protein BMS9Abin05_0539 [Rhodothermia bacterium]